MLLLVISLKVTTGDTVLEGVVGPSQAALRDELLDPAHLLLKSIDTLNEFISDLGYACLEAVT